MSAFSSIISTGCSDQKNLQPVLSQSGQETSSRQENPKPYLEIPPCRGHGQERVQSNPDRHTPGWDREPTIGQHIPPRTGYVYGIQVSETLRLGTQQAEKTGRRKLPLRPIRRRLGHTLQRHQSRCPTHERGTWRTPRHHG